MLRAITTFQSSYKLDDQVHFNQYYAIGAMGIWLLGVSRLLSHGPKGLPKLG
jgi:hypothetical protein